MIEWNNKWLIAGVSGTGKTWAALWLLSQYQKLGKRSYYVFLADNSRDYDNPMHRRGISPRANGFKLLTFGANEARKGWNWVEILRKHRKLYIETGNLSAKETQTLVNSLSEAFWILGNGLFCIDEAWLFLNRNFMPESFERLARGGRKVGVDLMAITQRVVDIHPDILSQFNVIVSFRLAELNDRERLARYFEPFRGKQARDIIQTLKQGEYLIKITETGQQERQSTFNIKG